MSGIDGWMTILIPPIIITKIGFIPSSVSLSSQSESQSEYHMLLSFVLFFR